MKRFLITIIMCLICLPTFASDLEELCKEGYGVIINTQVSGEFNGCDYNKIYKLDNGMTFECTEYSYSYNYRPDFYVLKNVKYGDLKYLIDDEEYQGTLYR